MFSRVNFRNFLTNITQRNTFSANSIKNQQQQRQQQQPQAATVEESQVELREITRDRTVKIPVETSIRYLKSAAYKQTYGKDPVWVPYRRNFKGQYAPRRPRKTCVRAGFIQSGNPCPICRDEYLVLHEENVDLLKQFISPYTGAILNHSTTGLCQKRHDELLVSINRAFDKGLLTFDVPFRHYDYSLYKNNESKE